MKSVGGKHVAPGSGDTRVLLPVTTLPLVLWIVKVAEKAVRSPEPMVGRFMAKLPDSVKGPG